jgi:hypothetical protein
MTEREDRIFNEILAESDTITAAVKRIAGLEEWLEATKERAVRAEAAQAVLESAIGVRGHALLAYGDTFAEIAGLLDVPIAGLAPEVAGPSLVAAVKVLGRDGRAMALLRYHLASLRLILHDGEPDGWQVGDGPVENDPAEAVLAAFKEGGRHD